MTMRIVDVETGAPVPAGQRGEFLLRGPNIMLGYHGQTAVLFYPAKGGRK